ncbi:DMT family transporter [Phycisphaera mikurensis]|uniref:Hypothetical membrane protein n=1 Tax=Phycisphaera mikurensis (strain NBRC 102666 / KCTC 22515 / FYK2301M01) TaxID=1142394 RepID=I0ICQ9_PHYMF|nr:DMT family transporter [Phycisphaera mikurensis]MBB6442079.1 drug/metabolite transporter (DMT)-like permease [Phycisphaera mikurensis]BAM03047.1 hypothetical membrane protein [Phycisphaera mikurensis NBRC 102666]
MLDTLPIGEAAALGAAAAWAVSSILWVRIGLHVRATVVSLVKGVLALGMLAAAAWAMAVDFGSLSPLALGFFALSGVLGIGFGDTLYLDSLNRLGPTRSLLVAMLAPPLTILGGWAVLQERVPPLSLLGVAVTVAGVAWVVTRRERPAPSPRVQAEAAAEEAAAAAEPAGADAARRSLWLGLATGGLGAAMQAASLIVNRYGYAQGEADATLTTIVRIAAGVAVLAAALPLLGRPAGAVPVWRLGGRLWGLFVAATLIGTAGGMVLMQVAVDRGHSSGVVQTLLSTSPLFVMPMVALTGERLSLSAVAGALVATAGLGLLFAGL